MIILFDSPGFSGFSLDCCCVSQTFSTKLESESQTKLTEIAQSSPENLVLTNYTHLLLTGPTKLVSFVH